MSLRTWRPEMYACDRAQICACDSSVLTDRYAHTCSLQDSVRKVRVLAVVCFSAVIWQLHAMTATSHVGQKVPLIEGMNSLSISTGGAATSHLGDSGILLQHLRYLSGFPTTSEDGLPCSLQTGVFGISRGPPFPSARPSPAKAHRPAGCDVAEGLLADGAGLASDLKSWLLDASRLRYRHPPRCERAEASKTRKGNPERLLPCR